LYAWQDDAQPLRLVEQTVTRDDPDPQALACYGLLARCWDAVPRREDLWLRFGPTVKAFNINFAALYGRLGEARARPSNLRLVEGRFRRLVSFQQQGNRLAILLLDALRPCHGVTDFVVHLGLRHAMGRAPGHEVP
jgi:hypothetical protein